MNTDLSTNEQLIVETRELLHAVRGSLIHVAQNLYRIKTEGIWEGRASSWSEFCESDLQISQSQASKLLSIHQHFIVDGGLQPEDLIGTDYEKLNAVRKLPGTVQEQMSIARTLSRKEIRDSFSESIQCEHTKTYVICADCGTRIYDAE